MKIAYVSHVDYRWIKQRPHFIAEGLNARPGCVTFYCCGLFSKKSNLSRDQELSASVLRLPLVPQRMRRYLIGLDRMLDVLSICIILLICRPNAVILSHPRFSAMARICKLFRVVSVYDCMDLNGEFKGALDRDSIAERRLTGNCSLLLASSSAIAAHLASYGDHGNILIVRNGVSESFYGQVLGADRAIRKDCVSYYGTISQWLDLESIMALLDDIPTVHVNLFGPIDIRLPEHPRLLSMGIVSHESALEGMTRADVLIMPFKVNRLILGVDPVKVYEYIVSGRPTVVRDYPGLDHFGPLVSRYDSPESFVSLVRNNLGRESRSRDAIESFTRENSWYVRCERIAEALTECSQR